MPNTTPNTTILSSNIVNNSSNSKFSSNPQLEDKDNNINLPPNMSAILDLVTNLSKFKTL